MTSTLRDSGISEEHMLVYLSEALGNMHLPTVEWTQDLNQRCIDLIDRKIAGNISYDEKIELANLTNALRASVDNEELFPLAGARSLHDKLKAMESNAGQP